MNQVDYSSFSTDDFLADEYFQQWVLHSGREDDSFWQAFLRTHPHQYTAVVEAKALLQGLQFEHGQWETASQVENVWHRIQRTRQAARQPGFGDGWFRPGHYPGRTGSVGNRGRYTRRERAAERHHFRHYHQRRLRAMQRLTQDSTLLEIVRLRAQQVLYLDAPLGKELFGLCWHSERFTLRVSRLDASKQTANRKKPSPFFPGRMGLRAGG